MKFEIWVIGTLKKPVKEYVKTSFCQYLKSVLKGVHAPSLSDNAMAKTVQEHDQAL